MAAELSQWVSVSEGVRLSGLSIRTLKRIAKEGRLKFSRTPGGQYRFRREDLEKLAAGDGSARDIRPGVSTVQNMRDEVESLNLEVAARQAKRKLASIEAEDQAAKRETAEATRAQALADARALAEMRLDRIRKREEREAARAEGIARRERADWVREITNGALASLPRHIPSDVEAAVIESIHDALASLGPAHSQQAIAIVVSGAITRGLTPWRHGKEIERAIEEAERTLPWDMRAIAGTTEWQLRFRAAAEAAISALPTGTPLGQIRAAAQSEARKLVVEFERGQAEERHRRTCAELVEGVEWRVLEADSGAAREAVEKALEQLEVGCARTDLEKAADRTLVAFEQRKKVTKRAERSLNHVTAYIEQLGGPDGDWDLGDYFDRCKLAGQLKKKIRPDLLESMLTGEVEDDEDAQNFIENAIDSMVD
jgi:excisionase family DNA binding protein